MSVPAKYQPYRGYGCAHPHLWYGPRAIPPRRLRTRSDWRYPAMRVPWRRLTHDSADAGYEKRQIHRAFRHHARAALRRELTGDDAVSHNFRAYGDWLD
jgi:hypothetical protein